MLTEQQILQCRKLKVQPCEPLHHQTIGIHLRVFEGIQPINGLRHPPEGDTCGWYIWAGEEFSTDDDFFKSMHVEHLNELLPGVVQYLALPPGWRFLIASNYEDVWYDETLIKALK